MREITFKYQGIKNANINFVAFLFLMMTTAMHGQLPFQNPKLSSELRAKDLVSRLSLNEKARLMCDESDTITRFGIKKFNWWSEGLNGIRYGTNVSVFPQSIGMAASFDDRLVYDVFNAVSDEFRVKYNVDIAAFSAGLYFVSVKNNHYNKTMSIIIA